MACASLSRISPVTCLIMQPQLETTRVHRLPMVWLKLAANCAHESALKEPVWSGVPLERKPRVPIVEEVKGKPTWLTKPASIRLLLALPIQLRGKILSNQIVVKRAKSFHVRLSMVLGVKVVRIKLLNPGKHLAITGVGELLIFAFPMPCIE